ncbi:MAG: cbb3-type cytochrome c oxidase N-terminal domain-containing protein, partial [Gemmobacter sp.]
MSKRPETTTRPGDPGTTGHSWDGIEEFNNPLPRWWLWIFYATIVWALIYSVAYPAWPLLTRATPGVLGHSTRADVAAEIARFDDANGPIKARLIEADFATVTADADLMAYAVNAGAA